MGESAVERGEPVVEGVARRAGLDISECEKDIIVDHGIETGVIDTVGHYR